MARSRKRRRKITPPATPPVKPKQPDADDPTKPVARKPAAPNATPPKAVSPKAVSPKAVSPKAVSPKAVSPKAVSPKAVSPKAVSPKGKSPAAAAQGAPPKQDPLIGASFARCKIQEQIGRGRTARVYRAFYDPLQQDVAIKVLLSEAAAIQEIVAKFEHEARVLARIDNENVLKVYDVGAEAGLHFMVMELLEGEEILDLIEREGQVDPTDALRIVRQAANGMAAAHDKGLVHRDIKPQNLYLCEDGTVKVLDFGLAVAHDATTERVGTPHFMAPEVCESGQADLPSDVYSLGIVLYHLLVGQPPYAGQGLKEILHSHMARKPLHPERQRPGLSNEIADLTRTLTKPDPLTRPSAQEVVRLLDEMGGEALRDKGSLRGRRRRSSKARTAVARRQRLESRNSKTPLIVGGVLLGALALGALAMMNASPDEPTGGSGTAAMGTSTTPSDASGTSGYITDVEDPIITAARERESAAAAEREKLAKIEAEAQGALKRAEDFARTWTRREDTEPVLERYATVRHRFPKTEVAKLLKKRVRGIKAGDIHPHPDRSWDAVDAVESTRTQWKTDQPKVVRLLQEQDYKGARELLPEIVQDATGALAAELRHWHAYVRQVGRARQDVIEAFKARKAGADPLEISLEDTTYRVTRIDAKGLTLHAQSKRQLHPWSKLTPLDVFKLNERLLPAASIEQRLNRMAFAHAHGLEDAFWETSLELDSESSARSSRAQRAIYKDTFVAR